MVFMHGMQHDSLRDSKKQLFLKMVEPLPAPYDIKSQPQIALAKTTIIAVGHIPKLINRIGIGHKQLKRMA
jgi:hypothetical protein